MGLKVWLPLNGDLRNQGTSNLSTPTYNSLTLNSNGKIGSCYSGQCVYHLSNEFLENIWSVCAWIKADSWYSSNNIILCKNAAAGDVYQFYFSVLGGTKLGIGINNYSQSTASVSYTFSTGTWYHVAATYNGSTYRLYINGEEKKNGTITNAYVSNMNNIGINCRSSAANGTGRWIGDSSVHYINDIRIYDHCLSAAEVREIAQGLVLHYKLDNGGRNYNLFNNTKLFTANNWALTRSTVPEIGLVRVTPTASAAYAKYKTDLNYTEYNNKTYTLSFDAQEIPAIDETYTTSYIRVYYGFNLASRLSAVFSSSYDAYTYKNITLKGEGWQHYSMTFSVSDSVLTSGKPEALVDGSVLTIELGRLASKKPIEAKNIKLEIGDKDTGYDLSLADCGLTQPIIKDSSGYNHNGTITGNIQITSDSSRYSNCIYIPSGNTDYITTNDEIGNFSEGITTSIWFKSSNQTPGNNYHELFNIATATQNFEHAIYKTGYFRGGMVINGTRYVANTDNTNLTDGNWHHIAMTYNGAILRRYVDGIDKSDTTISGTLTSTSCKFLFGHYGTNTSYYAKEAYLSDARIYCTALDADAIRQLYEVGAKADNLHNLHSFELNENRQNEITKTGQLRCSTFSELNGMSYLKYDPNLYIEPDGSCWVRVYHHNNPGAGSFSSTNDFEHSVYIDENRWFNVEIANYLDKWEIMMKGKFTSTSDEWKLRWIQQYNPMTATYANVAVANVTKITDGYSSSPAAWGGLYAKKGSAYLTANNGNSGNWWGAVGSYSVYQNGIPGWGPTGTVTTTGYNDMYLRIDNVTFTSPTIKTTKNNIWTGKQIIEV